MPLPSISALRSEAKADQPGILEPETVKQFKRLNLAAKLIVKGFFQGLNRSVLKGSSIEFADLRDYSPGDDLRLLDWKAYARTDRFFIRQFEAEQDASILFLLDSSPSMSFTSNGMSKFDYGKYLIAALSFIGSSQHDRVGLFVSSDRDAAYLPPHKGRVHLHRLLHALGGAAIDKDTAPFTRFTSQLARLKKRAIIVAVSDLLGDRGEISPFLRRAAFAGHNLILFHLLDKAEQDLSFNGAVHFVDLEGPAQQTLGINQAVRQKYQLALTRHCASIKSECARLGAEYTFVSTDMPYDVALVAYLLRRRQLKTSRKYGAGSRWMRRN